MNTTLAITIFQLLFVWALVLAWAKEAKWLTS